MEVEETRYFFRSVTLYAGPDRMLLALRRSTTNLSALCFLGKLQGRLLADRSFGRRVAETYLVDLYQRVEPSPVEIIQKRHGGFTDIRTNAR